MYEELYQYLIHHRTLPVPGIGTFLLERHPSKGDFPNRVISGPAYQIIHRQETLPFPKYFFSRLGNILGVGDREATSRFNAFAATTREQVEAGKIILWKGVGTITKKKGGEINFSPDPLFTEDSVKASKVIRENAQHTVRVGEDEKTSVEMSRMLNVQEIKRSTNWLWPALLIVLSILFIGWYLSNYGVSIGSAGNTAPITVEEGTSSYQTIQ